jgi:hypothetical protein
VIAVACHVRGGNLQLLGWSSRTAVIHRPAGRRTSGKQDSADVRLAEQLPQAGKDSEPTMRSFVVRRPHRTTRDSLFRVDRYAARSASVPGLRDRIQAVIRGYETGLVSADSA